MMAPFGGFGVLRLDCSCSGSDAFLLPKEFMGSYNGPGFGSMYIWKIAVHSGRRHYCIAGFTRLS